MYVDKPAHAIHVLTVLEEFCVRPPAGGTAHKGAHPVRIHGCEFEGGFGSIRKAHEVHGTFNAKVFQLQQHTPKYNIFHIGVNVQTYMVHRHTSFS